ncbi:MAG: hypothetical protein MJE77_32320 [Proteobacteria bacterium]|nr:hypothetical protein [Pseudomonadota bacterium]
MYWTNNFCFTMDVDWASEYCIDYTINSLNNKGIKPTVFVTHPSKKIDDFVTSGAVDVGLHPNFLPGSSHGENYLEVIDYVSSLQPEAKTYRSHSFFDNTHITREFVKRGIEYDSNLCLHFQEAITPLRHGAGIVRMPVFWEDDCHWSLEDNWDLSRHEHHFLTIGLKILNIHPFCFTLNVPNEEYYLANKKYIPSLDAESVAEIKNNKSGVETFVNDIIELYTANDYSHRTLAELYAQWRHDKSGN